MIGALRERVRLERPVEQPRDALGGRPRDWQPLAEVWAKVSPRIRGPSDGPAAGEGEPAGGRVVVTVRRRAGLVPGMRVIWGGRCLIAERVITPEGRPGFRVLECREVTGGAAGCS